MGKLKPKRHWFIKSKGTDFVPSITEKWRFLNEAKKYRFLARTTTWINSNCFTYIIKIKKANSVKRIHPYWKTISHEFYGHDIYGIIAESTTSHHSIIRIVVRNKMIIGFLSFKGLYLIVFLRRRLFLGRCLAFAVFWDKTQSAPIVTARLAKIAILARMLFETFLLSFRNINFSP